LQGEDGPLVRRLHEKGIHQPLRDLRDLFMPGRIEDYALVGDCQTAGLIGRDGRLGGLYGPRPAR
jgi:hypothetical protein